MLPMERNEELLLKDNGIWQFTKACLHLYKVNNNVFHYI
jgi:hypothetical protein